MIEISFRIRLKFFHSHHHHHLEKPIVNLSHLPLTIVLAVISVDQPGGYR